MRKFFISSLSIFVVLNTLSTATAGPKPALDRKVAAARNDQYRKSFAPAIVINGEETKIDKWDSFNGTTYPVGDKKVVLKMNTSDGLEGVIVEVFNAANKLICSQEMLMNIQPGFYEGGFAPKLKLTCGDLIVEFVDRSLPFGSK
jgi:hypothetical protein